MTPVDALVCRRCGRSYAHGDVEYTCPEHEGVAGILDVRYDDSDADATLPTGSIADLWAFEPWLPVSGDPVRLGAGGTPLLDAPALSAELGVETLVKDETGNPTGSNKDRASAVVVSRARQLGHETVACASTGNAAASLSGYAARGGLDCRIFVPGDAPEGKLAQPLVYGADVLAVEGTYDEAYDLSVAVTEEYGWYNRNAAINPFQVEGKRTVGHELAEQSVVRGEVPDWVVFSMGDGCTIAGAWKGFREFYELGYVDDHPKMLGVQADGATAIHDAFHGHEDVDDVAETLADSIAVGRPRNTVKACRALEESGGTSVLVSDEEILDAMRVLGSSEGIFAEPAAATPVAGVREALSRDIVDEDDTVVVCSTGFGLKDTEGAKRATGGVTRIEPDMDEVDDLYGDEARVDAE